MTSEQLILLLQIIRLEETFIAGYYVVRLHVIHPTKGSGVVGVRQGPAARHPAMIICMIRYMRSGERCDMGWCAPIRVKLDYKLKSVSTNNHIIISISWKTTLTLIESDRSSLFLRFVLDRFLTGSRKRFLVFWACPDRCCRQCLHGTLNVWEGRLLMVVVGFRGVVNL